VTDWVAGLIHTLPTPGAAVGTIVGTAVGTVVGAGVTGPSIPIVPPVPFGVPMTKPAASFKFLTERPMFALAALEVAVNVILMRAKSALPAMPVALNPAVIIWPATVVLFVRLSPLAISEMVPSVKRFAGYVTVNPNAARAALPVLA